MDKANEIVRAVVCACGAHCDRTSQTDPPLDRQTAEIWMCLHQLVCPLLRMSTDA